ncbi:dynamin family protein [Escherichia coli]|uniref:dynamin family protein n=1 Tax=Escherichia coli TaxID=562 RepID=UPI0002CACEA4|nr:dynamin family protein [Escherichia coli]EFE0743042.1 dGTPase [Escherichia coli]EFF0478610.1 dGTPase [Escherichia coli]EGM8392097.1 dGTPase [Escherichia coli]EMW81523.1 50S ribosome-binding GTPase family protein [Escherichia coli 180600]EMX02120.1 50S ribosome-binding GTPase family protein [Escherichia coli P0304777.1]
MAVKKNGKKEFTRKILKVTDHYNVIVAATMSAGKSSLINALLGHEVLYSANEAATATLTRITHNRNLRKRIEGVSYTQQGECYERSKNVQSALIRQWNDNQAVKYIELDCRIEGLRKTAKPLVIYDTPGPNNSQDASHKTLLEEALTLPGKKLLVYVLNATQLATQDDKQLLQEIKDSPALASGNQIIFILNKVDQLDDERGETIEFFLKKTRNYLEQTGYSRPLIIPAMVQTSLIAKKVLSNKDITRNQKHRLQAELQRFRENKFNLNEASYVPRAIKRQIRAELKRNQPENAQVDIFDKTELTQFIAYSGIRTLEIFLSQHN